VRLPKESWTELSNYLCLYTFYICGHIDMYISLFFTKLSQTCSLFFLSHLCLFLSICVLFDNYDSVKLNGVARGPKFCLCCSI